MPQVTRTGWRRVVSEPVLYTAIGLVVGVLATVIVVHGGSGPPVIAARTAHPAGGGAGAPPAPVPAATIPPAAKPDPEEIGLVHVRPVSVRIPRIGVTSGLVPLGVQSDGTLQVPTDFAEAGWYSKGAYPGDADGPPALIVGHVDNYHGPAVFFRLRQLRAGDKVYVKRADGSIGTFVVYRTASYLKSQYPARSVYAPTRRPELRLITCAGQFDDAAGSYLSNFVAFAHLTAGNKR